MAILEVAFYSSREDSGVAVSGLDTIPGGQIKQVIFSGVWFATPQFDSKEQAIDSAIATACEIAVTERANGVIRFTPQIVIELDGSYSASVTMALVQWTIDVP